MVGVAGLFATLSGRWLDTFDEQRGARWTKCAQVASLNFVCRRKGVGSLEGRFHQPGCNQRLMLRPPHLFKRAARPWSWAHQPVVSKPQAAVKSSSARLALRPLTERAQGKQRFEIVSARRIILLSGV